MKLYGLTGGIGSGKSEAAHHFTAMGIPVIDADQAGHDVIAPGGAAEAAVLEAFGQKIRTHGRIDREKLAALVFRDEQARNRLNAIVHPAIMETVSGRCARLAASGEGIVVIEAALLGENGQREPWLEGLILVLCPEELRVHRLTTDRAMNTEEARRRIQAQTPPESKRAIADWVIENSGDIASLHAQVEAISEVLRNAD